MCLALAVVGGVLYGTGVIGAREDGVPEAACEGVVGGRDVSRAMEGAGLREVEKPDALAGEWLDRCALWRTGPERDTIRNVDFHFGWSDKLPPLGEDLWRTGSEPAPAIPLGKDWDGAIVTQMSSAHVVLQLPCAGRDSGLVVFVRAFLDGGGLRTPRQGRLLAEAVTRTAPKAAKKWDCRTKTGGPVGEVPVDRGGWVKAKPLEKASGACSAFRDMPGGMRKRLGVGKVLETPAGRTPLSDCYLAGDDGRPRYWAAAEHEGFGEPHLMDGPGTAFFRCHDYHGRARTMVIPAKDHDEPDRADRKWLLEAFTAAEVERYGCGKPEFKW